MTEDMMTFEDVLNFLGVEKKTLRELISSGVLKAYSEGGTFIFRKEDVDNYANNREEELPTVVLDEDLDDLDLDDVEDLDLDEDLTLNEGVEETEILEVSDPGDEEELSLDDVEDLDLAEGDASEELVESGDSGDDLLEEDASDLDDIDLSDLDDLDVSDEELGVSEESDEDGLEDISEEDLEDDYDGLDIGGLDVEIEEVSGDGPQSPNVVLNEDNEIVGTDDLTVDETDDLDDLESLEDVDLTDESPATLDEISLDDATGVNEIAEPTVGTVDRSSDTGMTEELDLGNDALDLSDDKLFPDDTSVTGDVTADFDLDDAVTGEISFTDPIDITEDLDEDFSEELMVGAAAGVGRIQVKKEMDWVWMSLMLVTLGVVIYAALPVTALHKRDYTPESLKSLVKDKSMAPASGGLSSIRRADGSKFGKIASTLK